MGEAKERGMPSTLQCPQHTWVITFLLGKFSEQKSRASPKGPGQRTPLGPHIQEGPKFRLIEGIIICSISVLKYCFVK